MQAIDADGNHCWAKPDPLTRENRGVALPAWKAARTSSTVKTSAKQGTAMLSDTDRRRRLIEPGTMPRRLRAKINRQSRDDMCRHTSHNKRDHRSSICCVVS
ncbi:hypothetical protein ACU4GD_35025 [Cupriavidus basilensis]